MKLVRTAALSRQAAPAFTALTDEEVIALRMLPAWVRWLYLELKAMSDFKTGLIYTSYARLAALLDCDQPPGGRRLDVPTMKQIRSALDTLNTMGLALRDRRGNEEKRELKIWIRPAEGFSASAVDKGREKGRPQKAHNYDEHGPKRKPDQQLGQRSGQGVQEGYLRPPIRFPSDELSTNEPAPMPDAVRQYIASKTKKKAPPGGLSPAPAGHAPIDPADRIPTMGEALGKWLDKNEGRLKRRSRGDP